MYIHCNFCLNLHITHGDMKENVSGCFFSEHSVYGTCTVQYNTKMYKAHQTRNKCTAISSMCQILKIPWQQPYQCQRHRQDQRRLLAVCDPFASPFCTPSAFPPDNRMHQAIASTNHHLSSLPLLLPLGYEGRSKSSRPDLVLFRIKLKYYLLLIVARLRTRHAQYDFWAINILCILAYEHSVCQTVLRWVSSQELLKRYRRDPAKITTRYSGWNVHPHLRFLSQNNKAFNGTNESVKIVISLHCVTPLFPCWMQTTDNR